MGRSFRENPFLAVRRDDFGDFGIMHPNGTQSDFCGKNLLAGFTPFDRIRNDFQRLLLIYFFTLLVEKLEYSRQALSHSVAELKSEVKERLLVESRLSAALDKVEKN